MVIGTLKPRDIAQHKEDKIARNRNDNFVSHAKPASIWVLQTVPSYVRPLSQINGCWMRWRMFVVLACSSFPQVPSTHLKTIPKLSDICFD